MPNEPIDPPKTLRALALALAIGASPLALATSPAMAAARIGTSAAVTGDVYVRGGASGQERQAQVRETIFLEDRVRTKQESALQILLVDRSIFTVGANCDMTIDRFVYDPDSGAGEMSARVVKGAFRFMSGRIGGNNPTNVNIATPSATIGIRGTFIESIIGVDARAIADALGLESPPGASPSGAAFYILRGPGQGHNTFNNTGIMEISNSAGSQTVMTANFAVYVPGPGYPPSAPFPVTQQLLDYLSFHLRSTPNGPPVNPLNLDGSGSQQSGQSLFNQPTPGPGSEQYNFNSGHTDNHLPPPFRYGGGFRPQPF
ncbi:FecR domain-containing protein [Afifella sp. IM 167]|uniref:FecR family protein n=1 Tax=Afifella sp. IM 167 TaxID=2033586 RepID=UPI001CC979D1|nr:FecR family protein [Afifella sp. IM 167]MBZ8134838.1 hypothetical protein [Afifella sp. IM 167]